ncbi:unnamed protein product, partial [Allacma fusca]
CIVVFDWQT